MELSFQEQAMLYEELNAVQERKIEMLSKAHEERKTFKDKVVNASPEVIFEKGPSKEQPGSKSGSKSAATGSEDSKSVSVGISKTGAAPTTGAAVRRADASYKETQFQQHKVAQMYHAHKILKSANKAVGIKTAQVIIRNEAASLDTAKSEDGTMHKHDVDQRAKIKEILMVEELAKHDELQDAAKDLHEHI